ncbi:mechanosensitive ion channel family protein [Flavobacterium terrae]|uniref:Small conductance mechanosensitive channel n=1 Tax=Flavobacterium terrae TaxID=415425 RepID=A0A1M6D8R2_9FLAO|nr:mechanosensitive ion channel domain-containing protein [Flavobacterium terrae]SHI69583.1 small conductance mechanosensitive channel [Flavobacterium terrae]
MIIDKSILSKYIDEVIEAVINYSPKILIAFFILIVGHYTINFVKRMILSKVQNSEFDITLSKFLIDILVWILRFLLFITFISRLGIETASFVAIIGAAGLAIGLSLQGSLSNFAGGILIVLFKPFEVGDTIEAQGVIGVVSEIQIFVTKLIAANNQTIFIPNGSLSNGTIVNHSLQGQRRTDLQFLISYDEDLKKVKDIVLDILNKNENVLQDPKPSVDVVALSENGVRLAVKSWATNDNFSKMNTQVLESLKNEFTKAGISLERRNFN